MREPMFSQKRGTVLTGRSLPVRVFKARSSLAFGLPSFMMYARSGNTSGCLSVLDGPACPLRGISVALQALGVTPVVARIFLTIGCAANFPFFTRYLI